MVYNDWRNPAHAYLNCSSVIRNTRCSIYLRSCPSYHLFNQKLDRRRRFQKTVPTMNDQNDKIVEVSAGDLQHARDKFRSFIQDSEIPNEMMRIRSDALVDQLRQRGVPLAVADALIDELGELRVAMPGKRKVLVRNFVPLSGDTMKILEWNEYSFLYFTKRRLRKYFEAPASPMTHDDNAHGKHERVEADPSENTVATVWTKKDGTLCFSTTTNGVQDGQVTFAPTVPGQLTLQIQLMMCLCHKWPNSATLAELIEQVYPEDVASFRHDASKFAETLRKLRSLVSDIRRMKLARAGLNRDILPSLNVSASSGHRIQLQVAKLNNLDDRELDQADEPAV